MTEPQIWTALGILAAALITLITVTTQSMMRTITAQFEGLKTEMILRFERVDDKFDRVDEQFKRVDEQFKRVDERFEQVEKRFEQVDQRFEQVDQRFEKLEGRLGRVESAVTAFDRDVQTIVQRVFPDQPLE